MARDHFEWFRGTSWDLVPLIAGPDFGEQIEVPVPCCAVAMRIPYAVRIASGWPLRQQPPPGKRVGAAEGQTALRAEAVGGWMLLCERYAALTLNAGWKPAQQPASRRKVPVPPVPRSQAPIFMAPRHNAV